MTRTAQRRCGGRVNSCRQKTVIRGGRQWGRGHPVPDSKIPLGSPYVSGHQAARSCCCPQWKRHGRVGHDNKQAGCG
jgi:hypothetical protein